MYEIKTDTLKQERKVLLDGMTVTITKVGAGSQLSFTQMQRRMDFIEKKIKAGIETEQDLDTYDALELKLLDFFASVMHDETETNEKVKAWVKATPLDVIQGAFEEMQRQFKETDQKALTNATTDAAS